MIATYFCVLFALQLLHYSHALQTGFTCETFVTLTCPRGRKLVVLEVTYSSECPRVADEVNGTSLYAPSRCVGYFRERASNDCNGQESCVVDNSLDQRPSFLPGKQANCGFKGQSVNIDYSCIPDFYSSKLPRVDICSMHSLDEIKEGFIHTPNYPETYPNDRKCEKKVPEPDAGHRLKIYIIDLDVEGVTSSRAMNDWLEINDNGERLYGAREPYTLIFDDVIEANLNFKSNAANGKRAYRGALLYFIVAPMRRPRPPTTTTTEEPINLLQGKALAFTDDRRPTSNVFLVLLVVLLSSVLLLTITGFLLYQRRNDRRIRYLTEMFSSFMPKGSKSAVVDSSEPSDDSHIKFDLSSSSHDEKPVVKHTRIDVPDSEHIYSQDPLTKASENALIYDYIDDDAIYQQVVKPTPKL